MKLQTFKNITEKKKFFREGDEFVINTKSKFDSWFLSIVNRKSEERTNYIFRGMKEAKHKLYTSAQRTWLENDMNEWNKTINYIDFINSMVQKAKINPLIKKVFDVYDYSDVQREFPILSILQHYGAPTPLMDWSYNINVALFFATENTNGGIGTDNENLDNYFSIYSINKSNYKNELLSLIDFSNGNTLNIESFKDFSEKNNANSNSIFYISDFDEGNAHGHSVFNTIKLRTNSPVTSVFNQNIVPQEGLFIFNPHENKTIDDIFNVKPNSEGSNLVLEKFDCYNIKKDLANYVKRKIKNQNDIDRSFIYPQLKDDAYKITEETLNSFVPKGR